MKTIEMIVQEYERGKYTATELTLRVLQIITDDNLDQIMAAVPKQGIADIEAVIETSHPSFRVWNGPTPAERAVALLRQWLTEHPQE